MLGPASDGYHRARSSVACGAAAAALLLLAARAVSRSMGPVPGTAPAVAELSGWAEILPAALAVVAVAVAALALPALVWSARAGETGQALPHGLLTAAFTGIGMLVVVAGAAFALQALLSIWTGSTSG